MGRAPLQKSQAAETTYISRSDASREELAELAQQANPDEIQLGEDEDEDEMDLEPNGQGVPNGRHMGGEATLQGVTLSAFPAEVRLEQQSVPAAVFGSLKED